MGRGAARSGASGKYLKKAAFSDIYQNLGLECSAAILQLASKTPLPAGHPDRTRSGTGAMATRAA
jgi:hypothetical protein